MNISLAGVCVCLVFSALFSSGETAFTSLSLFQIEAIKKRGRAGRIVERLAKKPDELISTILIGNNIVNISASALATEWALRHWGDWSIGIMTGVLTLVILIFGEVTPKRIAIAHNETVAQGLAGFLLVCMWVFKPFVIAVNAVSSLITRLFGAKRAHSLSLENIVQLMSTAEHLGIIDYAKGRMVKNVFRLGATRVQGIMTHRKDVFSLSASATMDDACSQASAHDYSVVPVYKNDNENIVGLVFMSDVIHKVLEGNGAQPLSDVMVQALYVLPNKSIGDLFTLFKRHKETFAIVIDEYGGLAGIVTMRDVIEEIVGEIYEDSDEEPRERIKKQPDGSYMVSGDAPLSLIAEIAGAKAPELPYVQTIAGYIAMELDRIPVAGDTAETPLGRFSVRETEANRVALAVFIPEPKDGV